MASSCRSLHDTVGTDRALGKPHMDQTHKRQVQKSRESLFAVVVVDFLLAKLLAALHDAAKNTSAVGR